MIDFLKGALVTGALFGCLTFASLVTGDGETRAFARTEMATVQTVVTLPNGHEYIVSEKETKVTYNTYNSDDPCEWEVVKY